MGVAGDISTRVGFKSNPSFIILKKVEKLENVIDLSNLFFWTQNSPKCPPSSFASIYFLVLGHAFMYSLD